MGLFSKEECSFCLNKVGFFSRQSLSNKTGYICKECEKKTSALVKIGTLTKDQASEHIAYMERQNKLYEEAYEVLGKDPKERFVYQFEGVVFADSIAMFEYISPKTKKRVYKELFRYDNIAHYEVYSVDNTNTQNGSKQYSEVGVNIIMNPDLVIPPKHIPGVRITAGSHPYVGEIKVVTGKNQDSKSSAKQLINKLDKLFGRYTDDSLFGSIKESFTGTQKQRAQYAAAGDALNALGKMAKAKISKKEEDNEAAKEALNNAKESALNLATNNVNKYQQIADEVEKKILG